MPLRPLVREAFDNRLPHVGRGFRHAHGGNELQLVWDTGVTVIRDGVPEPAPPGALFLHRHDEQHGVERIGAAARMLVINYEPDDAAEAELPALARSARRVWRLDDAQMAAYFDLFARLQVELDGERLGRDEAASAWMRLILVLVARLDERAPAAPTATALRPIDADVHRLRRAIDLRRQGSVDGPLSGLVDGYDALRHRFRRAYGESPARMLARLRVEKAKGLLAESLSIAAIAQQVGYARQHEFARAFRREVGCTPTAWRRQHRRS